MGGFAVREYVIVDPALAARVPDHLSWQEAAAIPVACAARAKRAATRERRDGCVIPRRVNMRYSCVACPVSLKGPS